MTKLNEYFENKLSAQEQLEVQMWLAENGYNPDAEAQLEELFDKLHVDDEAAARAAFQQVASRLGITAEARNTTACRSRIAAWSRRIAAILIVPLLCAVCLLYATRQPEVGAVRETGTLRRNRLTDPSRRHALAPQLR